MNYNFEQTIEKFKDMRVLVLGDAMLDVYLKGSAERLCREAPVPIVSIKNTELVPGGAANTAFNLAALGAHVSFLSVIGRDVEGENLLSALKNHTISTENIFIDKKRQTLTKKRILADSQLLVRFDYGTTTDIRDEYEDDVINRLLDLYETQDAVIISDYGYGVLTEKIISLIGKLQQQVSTHLIIDSKHLENFTGLSPTLIKPNYQEALTLLGLSTKKSSGHRAKQITEYREKILGITHAETAAITLDTEGAIIFDKKGTTYRTYANPVENAKAAGAGDTYTSAFALALAANADIATCAEIAAAASGVITQKLGTTVCTYDELVSSVIQQTKFITNRNFLSQIVESYRKNNKKIVFTNGCFDILHSGHVSYLNTAKSLGDILIVGVNSDESVARLKGPTRPINKLTDRMNVLSALSSVDNVISFHEDTPINLIEIIKPDVFVKGGDYTEETLPEAPLVRKYGGKVEILPYIKDHSTTNIIRRIHETA